MDFAPSPEQTAFRDSVQRLADKHLRDGANARARAEAYPWDIAKLMANPSAETRAEMWV